MTDLSERFDSALSYARTAHATQYRKGEPGMPRIPYLYHLLAVSSLVLEFGGDEDQAIAALLHDVVEDCGAQHETNIRAMFGGRVADIVMACTDGTLEAKAAYKASKTKYEQWLERKLRYIHHLRGGTDEVLLVSGCDKLHNARAILQDLRTPGVGMAVFSRFTGGLHGTLRYYYTLASIMSSRGIPVASELSSTVEAIHAGAGVADRHELDHAVYFLKVYDNFHYQDESETYLCGPYDGEEAALSAARALVRESVTASARPGLAPGEAFDHYVALGDDPVILGYPSISFSAWDYARELTGAITDSPGAHNSTPA